MKKINNETFSKHPSRFELRKGKEHRDSPKCSYGNSYRWIGYDLETKEYVRFTKGVFKKLIRSKIDN